MRRLQGATGAADDLSGNRTQSFRPRGLGKYPSRPLTNSAFRSERSAKKRPPSSRANRLPQLAPFTWKEPYTKTSSPRRRVTAPPVPMKPPSSRCALPSGVLAPVSVPPLMVRSPHLAGAALAVHTPDGTHNAQASVHPPVSVHEPPAQHDVNAQGCLHPNRQTSEPPTPVGSIRIDQTRHASVRSSGLTLPPQALIGSFRIQENPESPQPSANLGSLAVEGTDCSIEPPEEPPREDWPPQIMGHWPGVNGNGDPIDIAPPGGRRRQSPISSPTPETARADGLPPPVHGREEDAPLIDRPRQNQSDEYGEFGLNPR